MFPSPCIHLRGDEAPKAVWHKCPACNKLMEEEGIESYEHLQTYFTGRLVAHVKKRGKKAIVWNEAAFAGDLDPDAVVQYWMEMAPGPSYMEPELKKGRRLILSSTNQLYCSSYAEAPLRATLMYEPEVKGIKVPMENVLTPMPWEDATVHGEEALRIIARNMVELGQKYRSMSSGDEEEEAGRAEAVLHRYEATSRLLNIKMEVYMKNNVVIRPYQQSDYEQVQNVCIIAGSEKGKPDDAMQKLMLTVFCNYYIEKEPQNCFVATDEEKVVGYILSSEDSAVWADVFRKEYLPETADMMTRYYFEGSAANPLKYVSEYPVHLHIDIVPEYQRMGLGTKLMDVLISHLKSKNIVGVMFSVAGSNSKGQQFYNKYGFELLEKSEHEITMGMRLN